MRFCWKAASCEQDTVGRGLIVYCYAVLIMCLVVAGSVNADELKYEFDIPAMEASAALTLFAKQSDSPLLYSHDQVRDIHANEVHGTYTTQAALEILLRNTGIIASMNQSGVLTISKGEEMPTDKKKSTLGKFAAVLFAGLFAGQSADAQQDDGAAESVRVLEEVIVTAQKRTESVQDVPISINVLAGSELQKQGAFNTDDIANLFTNLSIKGSSPVISGFSIRGVGTDNVHPVAQQAVGQYHDEVGFASPYSGQMALFDLERVEVLRGPQNTLFGRNTTGGAVNFISQKPEVGGEFSGYGQVRAGNEGRLDFEGAIGAPIGENFAFRVAVQTQNRDGIFKNEVDGGKLGKIEKNSGRLHFLWEPSDETQVLATFTAGINRGNLIPNKGVGDVAANGVDPCPILTTGTGQFRNPTDCVSINPETGDLTNISSGDWHTVQNAAAAVVDIDIKIGSLKIIHDFDSFQFTSISAYETVEADQFYSNWSAAGYVGFIGGSDSEWKVFSQELRLTSTNDGALRWIAGAYYSHEDDLLATLVRNGAVGLPPQTVLPSVDIDQTVDVWSVYGQVDYDFSDRATLTVGLRYMDDRKEGDSTVRNMFGTDDGTATGTRLPNSATIPLSFRRQITDAPGVGSCPGLPCTDTIFVEQTLQEWGGKLSFDYRFTDEVMGYVSYSRGFKSGAFDTRALAAFVGTADQPVGPEFLDAYELGVKSTLADGSVELNAAVFYYEWEDMQIFDSDPTTGAPAFLNIPLTRIQGAEVDLRWSAGRNWYVQGGIGLIDSEIKDVGGLLGPVVGSRVNQTPEVSYNGLIRKDFELANSLLTLQTDFRYRSEMTSDLNENPKGLVDAEFFINARATISFGSDDQYELALWGGNLTEVQTCSDVLGLGFLTFANVCTPNDGMAFYGVTFQANF